MFYSFIELSADMYAVIYNIAVKYAGKQTHQ
jgi:hypothetical protein